MKLLGNYPQTGKRRGWRAGPGGRQIAALRKERPSDMEWHVYSSLCRSQEKARVHIERTNLQCVTKCQLVTGGTLWFSVAPRTGPRVRDWLTFCRMFRTTTLRWMVGGHRGDIEPGELVLPGSQRWERLRLSSVFLILLSFDICI